MLPYVPPNSVQINQIIQNHARSVCFVVYCYNTQWDKSQCSPQINIYVNYKKGALFHFDFFYTYRFLKNQAFSYFNNILT